MRKLHLALAVLFLAVLASGCYRPRYRDDSGRSLSPPEAAVADSLDERLDEIYKQADYLAYIEVDVTLQNSRGGRTTYSKSYNDREGNARIINIPYHVDGEGRRIISGMPYYSTDRNSRLARGVLSGSLLYHQASRRYYILTAGHIYDSSYVINKIVVWFKGDVGGPYEASLSGVNSRIDAAVLFLKPDFTFNGRLGRLGNSNSLKVTDGVVALGAPLDIKDVFSYGRVNSFLEYADLNGNALSKFVMHGAAIDFGNSGGPLIDMSGNIVGINVGAIAGGLVAHPLATPINDIKDVMNDLYNGVRH
ncbi:MAG: S1C family serine protease [bacterium]|nr:S1C family serine protease [bacterium]